MSSEVISIRCATLNDVDAMVRLRILMLKELGNLKAEDDEPAYTEVCRAYFARAMTDGSFVAWLGETAGGEIVAANGVVMYDKPPSVKGLNGRQGYVSNVFTEPLWRGQGIATRLMQALIDDARSSGIGKLKLGATAQGKGIYERLGFAPGKHEAMDLDL